MQIEHFSSLVWPVDFVAAICYILAKFFYMTIFKKLCERCQESQWTYLYAWFVFILMKFLMSNLGLVQL